MKTTKIINRGKYRVDVIVRDTDVTVNNIESFKEYSQDIPSVETLRRDFKYNPDNNKLDYSITSLQYHLGELKDQFDFIDESIEFVEFMIDEDPHNINHILRYKTMINRRKVLDIEIEILENIIDNWYTRRESDKEEAVYAYNALIGWYRV